MKNTLETDDKKLDPRIRRTREMLFCAFKELLREKPFEKVSVKDITDRSTLNRATFYDHFADKFVLLDESIEDIFQMKLAPRMAGANVTSEEGARQLLMLVCDVFAGLREFCKKSQHSQQFEPLVESKFQSVVRDFILKEFQHESQRGNLADLKLRSTIASWAICGAAHEWSHSQSQPLNKFTESALPKLLPNILGK
jgi:AcrR family transcriptional regulator